MTFSDLYQNRSEEFQDMDFEQRTKWLCELNIRAQIIKLSQLEVIQKAWEKGNYPILLGWYFDLNTGALKGNIFHGGKLQAKTSGFGGIKFS